MKCFNHAAMDAVGVCRACGRALCHECIAETDRSCACKGPCEATVRVMNDLIERGRSSYQKTSAAYLRNGIFIFLLGAMFISLAALALSRGQASEWSYFLLVVGILFGGMGISSLVSARRFKQK